MKDDHVKGIIKDKDGYLLKLVPYHPFCESKGYIGVHRLNAEKALGKYIDPIHVIHHVNEIKDYNVNSNLVVCESKAYHNLLHRRMRAYKETGFSGYLRCPFCKSYNDPKHMYVASDGTTAYHKSCRSEYRKEKRRIRNANKIKSIPETN